MGYISEGEGPKSNSNEISATNFKAWSCKICHNLQDLHATDTEWAQEFFILHYREIGGEKANAPSGIRTRDPALRKWGL